MSLKIEAAPQGACLYLDGEMTIYSALLLREELLRELPAVAGDRIEVDLSGVSEMDTAGLQIMLQVKEHCGSRLRFVNHSDAVLRVLETSRLASRFGDPVVMPASQQNKGRD